MSSSSTTDTAPAALRRIALSRGWTVCALDSKDTIPDHVSGRTFPAAVPGCVHTDLLDSDAIPDPYLDRNDEHQPWVGQTSWRYACTFTVNAEDLASDRVDLVCDGLDTVADLTLNGRTVGRSENMHVGHRFPVKAALREGHNELVIDFAAPLPFAQDLEDRMGTMPITGCGSNPQLPHNMMRKMACNFGWDWGPALVTAGIWRPIYLETWNNVRIDAVRPLVTSANEQRATVDVHIDLDRQGDQAHETTTKVTLRDPDGEPVAETTAALDALNHKPVTLDVTNPRLWWPIGYGHAWLYTLTVELLTPEAPHPVHTWTRRIGLRTSRLVTDPDPAPTAYGQGQTFHLEVNGQRVYCKGANWIPDDCFPSRITPQHYRQQVLTAREANMNMLRIWGGGIYEDHAFYDACDELGVMVWQDFTLACACYHEHGPFPGWIDAEARYNVARLAHHASLVLWNGCNENVVGVFEWGQDWRDLREQNKPWGAKYLLETFPKALADLDPVKPYWPASPYSGTMDMSPSVEDRGNVHIWDVWNGQGDCKNYLSHTPRFCSEFGFHGPPCFATLDRSIPQDQRWYDSPAMVHHNKHSGGQPLANERMGDYFVPPENFDDWLYLAQVVQARSIAMGVEWFRALSPWNSGALYWQFNDCWPVASWSAVDGDHRRKPLWYATRRFFAEQLLTIRPSRPLPKGDPFGPLSVYLHNDHAHPWTGELHVALHRVDDDSGGRSLLTRPIDVAPRGLLKVDLPEGLELGVDAFLVASVGAERTWWWPHPDRDVPYPQPEIDATVTRQGETYDVTFEARSLVRDLCLFADRLDPDARVSDQLLTLLPGERATIQVQSDHSLSPKALTKTPVLQCVNRFGASTRE